MRGTGGQLETCNKNNHESVEMPDRTPVFHISAQHPFTNQSKWHWHEQQQHMYGYKIRLWLHNMSGWCNLQRQKHKKQLKDRLNKIIVYLQF